MQHISRPSAFIVFGGQIDIRFFGFQAGAETTFQAPYDTRSFA